MPKVPSELDNGQVAVLTLKSLMSHLELGLLGEDSLLHVRIYLGDPW